MPACAELAVDGHVQLVDDRASVVQVRQEAAEHELQRAVAERLQHHARRRIVEDAADGLLASFKRISVARWVSEP